MGKFSESNYNILNEYFEEIIQESTGTDNSYLIGPRKTICMKGGVVTYLYEKRETGEFVGYKFRIISINGNQFKFRHEGLIKNQYIDPITQKVEQGNSLTVGDITSGNEIWFRKDSFFCDWLNVNQALYRDYININKSYNYFGKIYSVPEETDVYSITYEGMKDYMLRALPENNKTDRLQEFLNIYFDKVHHSVYNLTKNLWSMIDPKEIDIRFLNYIALNYGIEIDLNLDENKIRDWVDSIIYFLKRKGSYASIYIVFKLILGGTVNKLNVYERWDEWYRSILGDTPVFENDHHAIEYYGLIPSGGAGPDYYNQYTGYPEYTQEAPSGSILKNIWVCGDKENYFTYGGADSNNKLTVTNRIKLNIDEFDRSSNNMYLTKSINTSGDFYHCLKTSMSSASTVNSGLVVWGMSTEDGLIDSFTSNWLSVSFNYEVAGRKFIISEGYNNGVDIQNSTSVINCLSDTNYYLSIEKSDDDFNLYIYDDDERSNLLEIVTMTLNTSDNVYTYLHALNTITSISSGLWTGNVYDLSTSAVSAFDIKNKGNLILTPHYKVELDLSSEPIGDNYIINEFLIDELIRNWQYNKPVSKFVHYEELISPTAKMDSIGENVSLYDETKNAYLSTQFTGYFFIPGTVTSPTSGYGLGSLTYTYKQNIASYLWVINHDLDTEDLIVQVYDDLNNLIKYDEMIINDSNKISIYFNSSFKGSAYIVGCRPNYDYVYNDLDIYTPPEIIVNYDLETVENIAVSGGTCIQIDDNLIPHIVYHDYINNRLKYAKKVNDVWEITSTINPYSGILEPGIADIDVNTHVKPSMKIDTDGFFHISYNSGGGYIYYITNKTGDVWENKQVSTISTNGYSQMIIDSINVPHIIYCEYNSGIGYVKHSKKLGGLWETENIDTLIGGLFTYITATIDDNDVMYISYVDTVNSQIKYAYGYYHTWTLSNIENDDAYCLTISLDSSNNVHITYIDSNYDYKHITNMTGSWLKHTIDNNTTSNSVSANMFNGNNTSLTIDSSNVLHTIYKEDTNNAIKYAKFDINNWSGWRNTTIENVINDTIPETNWESTTNITDNQMLSVTFAPGVSAFNIWEGKNLYNDPTNLTYNVTDLKYLNDKWIIFDENNDAGAYSTDDGVTWTNCTTINPSSSFHLNSVCYGNSTYVAVGASGAIISSNDGIDWIRVDDDSGTDNFYSISYDNSLFVAVGENGLISTSTDAVSWTTRVPYNSDYTLDFYGIAYGDSKWVAVGEDDSNATIQYSSDGSTWSLATIPGDIDSLRFVRFFNGLFITGGLNGIIHTSTNGTTWTKKSPDSIPVLDIFDVTYANGHYIFVGDEGAIFITTNFEDWWQDRDGSNYNYYYGINDGWNSSFAFEKFTSIDYNNGKYIAGGNINSVEPGISTSSINTSANGLYLAGNNNDIFTSLDGKKWSTRSNNFESAILSYIYKIEYGNGVFVAVDDNGIIATSTNGFTWTQKLDTSDLDDYGFNIIIYNDGIFVVAGWSGIYMSDDNGETWTKEEDITYDYDLYGACYGNGLYLIVGCYYGDDDYKVVFKSTDGETWTNDIDEGYSLGTGYLTDIKYINDQFVLISLSYDDGSNEIYTSDDVITWTSINTSGMPEGFSNYKITYGNDLYLIGGNYKIVYSDDLLNWNYTTITNPPTGYGYISDIIYVEEDNQYVFSSFDIQTLSTDPIILDHNQIGFHITKDYLDNLYGTYSDYEEDNYTDLKYLTLSSYSLSANNSYWDINHSLETSGASGTVAQCWRDESSPISITPSGYILTNGDNMRIGWATSNAFGGRACIRRADYHWESALDSDSVSWDFLNTVDGWTSSDDVTLTTTPSSMIITPDDWITYESGWIERSLGT